MKRKKIGVALLFIQLFLIVGLLFVPKIPSFHAVNWKKTQTGIYAASVCADKAQKEKLNQDVATYLDRYNSYYEQDILSFHTMRVVASTPHLSILEIQTELKHNATVESKGVYLPAGEKTVQLWVYADGETVKTKWVTVSNSIMV